MESNRSINMLLAENKHLLSAVNLAANNEEPAGISAYDHNICLIKQHCDTIDGVLADGGNVHDYRDLLVTIFRDLESFSRYLEVAYDDMCGVMQASADVVRQRISDTLIRLFSADISAPAPEEEARFEVGKCYSNNFICSSDTWFTYKIVKRTRKTVWIQEQTGMLEDTIRKRKVHEQDGSEFIYPDGVYSMCPVLRPRHEVTD